TGARALPMDYLAAAMALRAKQKSSGATVQCRNCRENSTSAYARATAYASKLQAAGVLGPWNKMTDGRNVWSPEPRGTVWRGHSCPRPLTLFVAKVSN